jgi:hypothetical protein
MQKFKTRRCFIDTVFNFALEYSFRRVEKYQVELKLNGTHQLLAYAHDVNLLGDNVDNTKKNTETLTGSRKKVGLKINIEKHRVYVGISSPECRSKSRNKNSKQIVGTCVTVQIKILLKRKLRRD